MSNSTVPIKEFRLELSDLTYTGHDLVRPESVIAQPNGTLWVSMVVAALPVSIPTDNSPSFTPTMPITIHYKEYKKTPTAFQH